MTWFTNGPAGRAAANAAAAMRSAFLRLIGSGRRSSVERRLDDEMRFHIEMLATRHVRQGLSSEAARRAALIEFGGRERFKEDVRDEYRSRALEEITQDLRHAARVLRRNPAFTAASVLTFALGIGATTAVFSVVLGVLLRPLPYAQPDRLVALWEQNVASGSDRNVVSVDNFEAWRRRAHSFAGMAALVPSPATIAGGDKPERMVGAEVSPGYFRLLGVPLAMGRDFVDREAEGSAAAVVILSDGLWKSRFAADRSVLGKTLLINGTAHTVIGVTPADFDPPRYGWLGDQPFWLPFAATQGNRSWGRFLLVVARLAPGMSLESARAELTGVAVARAREDKSNVGWTATAVGLADQITGEVRSPLLVLLGAVGLLLLMAVANVGNLTLALTRRREHEIAVRRAIGATSRRLVRQLFTQSALLGAIGCVVGTVVAVTGVHLLVLLLPPGVPRAGSIRVDTQVLLFAAGTALVATIGFSCIAVVRGLGGRDAASLPGAQGRVTSRLDGGSLVTAEIALGLVLTVFALLMVRSFAALRAVELGFDSGQVVIARIAISGDRYAAPERQRAFFESLLGRVRAIPGVHAASMISTRPFGGEGPATTFFDPTRPPPTGSQSPIADVRYADADFFRTLRIPLLAGRSFDARERTDGTPHVVISQTMARTLFSSENPIGRRVRFNLFDDITTEVVGVVGDVHLIDPRTAPRPAAYLSASRFSTEANDILVRGDGGPESITALLRSAVAGLDPGLPVYQVATLQGLVDRSLARDLFTMLLLGTFAAIALLLAGVGVYGVFADDVTRRRKEIGIRLALGANSTGVVGLVVRRALARAALGVTLGGIAALLLTRSMASFLFGVRSNDPTSFLAVGAILLGVALFATLFPALRAARVSPLVAIRTE